jgi:hypothetical protein
MNEVTGNDDQEERDTMIMTAAEQQVLMPPLLPSPLEEVIQNDNQSKTWC